MFDTITELDLEGLQDQACRILIDGLNAEIARIDADREQADQDLYEVLGLVTELPMVCEPVVLFHPGHRPSLIEAPASMYPNVSVMAYRAEPRTSLEDFGTWYGVTLSVEAMVKAIGEDVEDRFTRLNQQAEELVNRRVQRTSRAIRNVVLEDRSLGGFLLGYGVGDTPSVMVGDVFVRRIQDGLGDRLLWQGTRLDFTIEKRVGD